MQPLTYRVLASLAHGDGDGNQLLERLRDLDPDGEPSLPTLYRALREAVERGWVEISEIEDPTGRGRPPRRYRLTDAGMRAAREEGERLRDLAALALGDDLRADLGSER